MQIENSRPRWGLVIALFVLLAALAVVPFLSYQQPKNLPTYQVQNFIGPVEIYSPKTKSWTPMNRGDILKVKNKLRTGPKGEVDLGSMDQLSLRLKSDSQLEVKGPGLFEKKWGYHLRLVKGRLLGAVQKNYEGAPIEVSTPSLLSSFESPMFHIQIDPVSSETSVQVLKGSARVRSVKSPRIIHVRGLEKSEARKNQAPFEATRVTRQEWNAMKETYELIGKSAAQEARQLDLSKLGGGVFEYVFDHGTFYTPEFGHAEREFIKDPSTDKVSLKIDYDVFPIGSFSGVYMKTRDLDFAKFGSLEFQARINPDEGFPESMRIEIKTATGMARVFVPRDFKQTWQEFKYPLIFRKSTPVAEITFVFSNEKAGASKKGTVYIKDFNLGPRPAGAPPAPAPPTSATPPADTKTL